jgi:hypothetical protein
MLLFMLFKVVLGMAFLFIGAISFLVRFCYD